MANNKTYNDLSVAKSLIKECQEQKNPTLELGKCGITDLNDLPELFECVHLESLNLINRWFDGGEWKKCSNEGQDNKLATIPHSLGMLNNLITIRIGGDYQTKWEITDVSVLAGLTGLQQLYLGANQLSDVSDLAGLTDLQQLDLRQNKLNNIPQFLFELTAEVTLEEYDGGINLYDNPIDSPPLEIIKQGKASVLEWFEANKVTLNEIKIILIGDPKAGKTSLLRRLKDGSFSKKEVQTDGVNIEDITFGKCTPFAKQTDIHHLTGHFWDFGGQDIMNATHQFFLTNRSVYILVLDARKDGSVSSQIRQWLKQIKVTGGNSPVIVVANQIDVNPGFGFDNKNELQKEFPQVKSFIEVSCETKHNMDLLKNKLAKIIPQAELFNTEIDERWVALKELLQVETKVNLFMSERRFLENCAEVNLEEKHEQLNAIKFLHDLGLVLHFDEVTDLADYYVLDPYWITFGVYQILTSAHAGKKKGKVSMNKLEYIVNEEEDKDQVYEPAKNKKIKKIQYSPNERRFLIDILNQFKLCFITSDRQHFIIPDLLDSSEPEEKIDQIRNAKDSIRFKYQYSYLPKSIMPRIIVETHGIQEAMWRTGCLLKCNESTALITTYQERISITVIGEHKKKREFMAVVRYLIDAINYNIADKPTMLIPLPGSDQHVDYEELLARDKRNEIIYTLYKPKILEFKIAELLEGVLDDNDNEKIHETLMEIMAGQKVMKENLQDIISTLNSHYDYLINLPSSSSIKDDLANAIKEINSQQSTEIANELMKIISSGFDRLEGKQSEKIAEIYNDISTSNDVQMKLKVGVPFINLLGITLESEFDIKGWAERKYEEMYEKYQVKLFRLMGYLEPID